MFRKKQSLCLSAQPPLREKTIERKEFKGGIRNIVKVRVKHPDNRIRFDEYGLKELIQSGVKLEQINTKVIEPSIGDFERLDDVPRETTETEENPF